MADKAKIELMQEEVVEKLGLMREVINEDAVPIIKYWAQLEKKAFDKAYEELKKLEEEV